MAMGQQEYTLHFNRDLVQSSHTNPAIRFDNKFSFLFPSIAFNYGNNAFVFDDLIKDSPLTDSTYLDVNGVIDQMDDENILQIQSVIDVFGLYFGFSKWYFSFFMTEKVDIRFRYTRDLIDLAWNGNAQFIGQTIEIGPALDVEYYKELSLGVGRHFEKWDVGLRMKLLSGMANISSRKNSLQLTTDEDYYATSLSADYEIRTSGVNDPFSRFLSPPTRFDNPGYAFDFGAVYRLNEKWQFSQSVLDLGMIKWRKDVKTYRSSGTFEYTGVDLSEFIDDDEVNFDQYTDSLKELYFQEEEGGSYQNNLVPKTYSSVLFNPDDKTNIGALVHLAFFDGVQFGASLYAGRQVLSFVNIGLSYSIKNRRYDNVGLNLNLGGNGFKVFVVTDNVVSLLQARNGRNVTWRYGINVNVGKAEFGTRRKKDRSEPEVPKVDKEEGEG